MRLCTLEFIGREAGHNVCRNVLMSLACLTTVAVTLGFSGFMILAFRNVEHLLHHVAQELVVAVYLKTDTPPDGVVAVGQRIAAMPHVTGKPVLVGKDHAWTEFSATIPDSLKGEVNGNPLPDAYMVKADAPNHVPEVARAIEALPGVEKINAPYLEAQRAGAVIRFARLATTAVTGLLLLITTFLVMNTIRLTLYARRQEIRVMQLVGATNGYIRTPFILEGLMLGAMGGALACASVALGYPSLLRLIHQSLAFDLPLIHAGKEMLPFYAQMVGIGAAVGAFGSLVSVRRFLKPVELQSPVRRLRPRELTELQRQRELWNAEHQVATPIGDPTRPYPGVYSPDFNRPQPDDTDLMVAPHPVLPLFELGDEDNEFEMEAAGVNGRGRPLEAVLLEHGSSQLEGGPAVVEG